MIADTTKTRLDNVQVLRAVAAIAVVVSHSALSTHGKWGVDLFFAISGFIIAYVTEHRHNAFLVKRLIRIVPLYWLGTLGVFAIGLWFPAWLAVPEASMVQLIKSMLFVPFERENGVYPLLFLGWTLNLEMLFYLLFALAIQISHRHRVFICAGFLIALQVLGAPLLADTVIGAFYTQPLILEFCLGMLVFVLYRWMTTTKHAGSRLWGFALILVCGVWLGWSSAEVAGIKRVWLWGVPTAVLLAATFWLPQSMYPKWLSAVGDASYSLYLFHPYLLVGLASIAGLDQRSVLLKTSLSILFIALSIAAAMMVYRFLERPITNRLRHLVIRSSES